MSWNKWLACLAIGAFCGILLRLWIGGPYLPIETADGAYFNKCCGTVILKGDQISIRGQKISYVIERSKAGGVQVTPKFYIGASEQGFVIRPRGYPLIWELDGTLPPQRLRMLDEAGGGKPYSFLRQPVS